MAFINAQDYNAQHYVVYLEFPQTVIQKGICLPKEQSADFLKNSEWQFCD